MDERGGAWPADVTSPPAKAVSMVGMVEGVSCHLGRFVAPQGGHL